MSKIIGPFLELPGILITLSIIFYLIRRKKLFLVFAAALYLVSAEIFWIPVQKFWVVTENPVQGDVIILGGGAIVANGETFPSRSTLERLLKGFEIWKNSPKSKIFVCGGKTQAGVIEADVMREILISWGVPKNSIVVERNSKNTYENLKNIRNFLSSNVNIITSSFHTRRTKMVARKLSINARIIAADYVLEEKINYRSFLPQISTLEFLGYLSHEIVGVVYYYITGKGR